MNKNILIHNDNVKFIDEFEEKNKIKFKHTHSDIDKYISDEIIKKLEKKEFDVIFIKDNLSSNYLELLGLRVAYHIRLSKIYSPIVILSDVDSYILNKINPMSNIVFTKGIFITQNTKDAFKKIKTKNLLPLAENDYKKEFLNKIKIVSSKDISGRHDIANKWSIYRWGHFLCVNTENIKINRAEIENMLYFKYLKEVYKNIDMQTEKQIHTLKNNTKGNVLLIDDEWSKGWSDIIAKIFDGHKGIGFQTFEYDFKDKSNFQLIMQVKYKELKQQIQNSDVLILDLRLIEQDHNKDIEIDSYSGVKILEKIYEINAGIQVIMLTATSKSTILEKLYEKKILGYIKKEHPEDRSISTVENINKFIKLIYKGIKRKYLKEIFNIKSEIINLLNIKLTENVKDQDCEIFKKFDIPKKHYMKFAMKLHRESLYVFEVLDSFLENRFIYSMLSIVSSFEAINSIFIEEKRYDRDKFWDGSNVEKTTLNDKLEELYKRFHGKGTLDIKDIIKKRNDYLHSNIQTVHIEPKDILKLFKAELKMLQVIKDS